MTQRQAPGGLFGIGKSWDIDATPTPWGDRPSIYEHVLGYLPEGTGPMEDEGRILPDEERQRAAGALPWAPGAKDGVLSHHEGGDPDEEDAEEVMGAIQDVVMDSGQGWVWRLYGEVCERPALRYVDPLVRALAADDEMPEERLYKVGRWLATGAADREAVKAGIAILGLFHSADGHAILEQLGRHDEFSLYAGVALSNTSEDSDEAVWDLARAVHGWGRIHLVERLIDTDDTRIKAWLIREGYRNNVLIDYLAHACATAGDLRSALDQPTVTVDEDLNRGAGDLIEALFDAIIEGPAPGIDEFADAGAVVDLYMRHVTAPRHKRAKLDPGPGLRELHVVQRISNYVHDEDGDWEDRADRGWTDDVRDRVADRVDEFMAGADWAERVRIGLESDDPRQFILAAEAAPLVGVDAWRHWFQRLVDGEEAWVRVSDTVEPERMDQVIEVARQRLSPDSLATGPPRLLGLPIAEHSAHAALLCLLSGLCNFPGKAPDLVMAGLRSPVAEIRLRAADALESWPRSDWPDDAETVVERVASDDDDDDIRARFHELAAGISAAP